MQAASSNRSGAAQSRLQVQRKSVHDIVYMCNQMQATSFTQGAADGDGSLGRGPAVTQGAADGDGNLGRGPAVRARGIREREGKRTSTCSGTLLFELVGCGRGDDGCDN